MNTLDTHPAVLMTKKERHALKKTQETTRFLDNSCKMGLLSEADVELLPLNYCCFSTIQKHEILVADKSTPIAVVHRQHSEEPRQWLPKQTAVRGSSVNSLATV